MFALPKSIDCLFGQQDGTEYCCFTAGVAGIIIACMFLLLTMPTIA